MSLGSESAFFFGASGAGGGGAGYQVNQSLRFNSADSAYLDRTPSVEGNRRTLTWSGWVKRSTLGTTQSLFSSISSVLYFAADRLNVFLPVTGNTRQTTQTFTDVSGWYHILMALDTIEPVAADRLKLYVNGLLVTDFDVDVDIAQNFDSDWNSTNTHTISQNGAGQYLDVYLAEVNFIDGQALDPSSFGEFDANGVWQPKEYTFTSVINTSQVWSNNTIGTFAGGLQANAFNGLLGSNSSTERVRPNDPSTAGFTFSGLGAVTSLRIWVVKGGAGGSVFNVNGTDVTSTVDAAPDNNWVDFGSTFTSLSEITFDALSGSTWYAIAGVEVNGQILIDTGVRTDNSFYLPFEASDLGADESGLGNDWTPNNFVTRPYNQSQNWSATASIPGGAGFEATKAFDGNDSSASSTYYFPASNGIGTFTFAQSVPYSTIKIFYGRNNGRLFVNGVDMEVSTTGYAELNQAYLSGKGVSSPLVSIGMERVSSGNGAYLFGVEVDGSKLVDPIYSSASDSVVDSPTNGNQTDTGVGGEVVGNYATLNTLTNGGVFTLSNGNLEVSDPGTPSPFLMTTTGVNSGKWYWEVTLGDGFAYVGAAKFTSTQDADFLGALDGSFMYNTSTPQQSWINAAGYNYGSTTATTGDVIGVSLDFDSDTVIMYKNGVSLGTFGSNILGTDTWTPAFKSNVPTSATFNFGQQTFANPAPAGFEALCTTNLDEPVIPDGQKFMDAVTYIGNGTSQTISGLEFSPDLVWLKCRNDAQSHQLVDTVRGATNTLFTNLTNAETVYNSVTAFNSDGFDLGNHPSANQNNDTYVAWCWDAGNTTVTNNDGTIESQVRANPSAGFSVVTYTGTGLPDTVGHGLNAEPKLNIIKRRNGSTDWAVYTDAIDGSWDFLSLNTTGQKADTTVFSAGNSTFNFTNSSIVSNSDGDTFVAYCWAPVEGYSAFGSYIGNNNVDGPFVFTRFKPRWVLIKATESPDGNWILYDSARAPNNLTNKKLGANSSVQENDPTTLGDDTFGLDFLSNGFKLRCVGPNHNIDNSSYFYAAFADSAFPLNNRAR